MLFNYSTRRATTSKSNMKIHFAYDVLIITFSNCWAENFHSDSWIQLSSTSDIWSRNSTTSLTLELWNFRSWLNWYLTNFANFFSEMIIHYHWNEKCQIWSIFHANWSFHRLSSIVSLFFFFNFQIELSQTTHLHHKICKCNLSPHTFALYMQNCNSTLTAIQFC